MPCFVREDIKKKEIKMKLTDEEKKAVQLKKIHTEKLKKLFPNCYKK